MTEGLTRKPAHGPFIRIAEEGEGALGTKNGQVARKGAGRAKVVGRSLVAGPEALPLDHLAAPKRKKRSRIGGKSRSRAFLPLLLSLSASLAIAATAVAFVPGTFVLRKVVVAGATNLAANDVIAASGIVPGKSLFSVDLGLAARNLEAWAPVASAKVRYVLPDAIRLEITERRAVALALVEDGPTTVPIAIDAEGYAFAKARTVDAPELPLLSGIRFDGWKEGMRLPPDLLPTVKSLAVLSRTDPSLLSLFSEIRIERTNWGEIELVLFPLHHAIPVRTGPQPDAALLRSIVLVLDALDKGGVAPKVGELDFRSGTIVFRSKEGRSG